jgi:hypothetical protein
MPVSTVSNIPFCAFGGGNLLQNFHPFGNIVVTSGTFIKSIRNMCKFVRTIEKFKLAVCGVIMK